jgi:hypothetical protein
MNDRLKPAPIPRPRPRPTDHVSTPPGRNGGTTNGAFQGAPNGNARAVVEHSVYNWVELVYQAFGLEVPSDKKAVALLGVRESTFADGAGADAEAMVKKEKAAANAVGETAAITEAQDLSAATRAEDRFTRDKKGNAQTGKDNSIVKFNDMLYMVWTEEGQDIDQHVAVFRCTIDPGANESDTAGTPLLLEGHAYKAKPTNHKGKSGALQVYSGTAPTIRLAREATKTRNIFTNVKDAMISAHGGNGNQPWLFVADEENTSIHVHWSLDYGDSGVVKNWSTGCTVLAHGRDSDRYKKDFRERWEAAPNKDALPYLVVSSKYLVMYDDWQAELRKSPGTKATVASVIKKSGIPLMPAEAPAVATGRLPSIATEGFVKEVQAAIKELDAGTYASAPKGSDQAVLAANLRASLLKLEVTTLVP